MGLEEEIFEKSKTIATDSYPMSIGELMNLYEEGDLEIHPDFQRFFRWTDSQKDKLIESILLGIPIPSIFVSQNEEGIWDVIDGLQRLSTIFEFAGILKDRDGKVVEARSLGGTEFLPSLEGKVFSEELIEVVDGGTAFFSNVQRRDFKREKLEIQIVKKSSDNDVKFELFQRLNTGGTSLSDQEIRNCLMIMLDREFYLWFEELYQDKNFKSCFAFTVKQQNEREDMEFLLRYLVYRYVVKQNKYKEVSKNDMGEYLTYMMREIIFDINFDKNQEKIVFEKTFDILNDALGEDSFKKYDNQKNKFTGASLISCFEAIVPGLSLKIESLDAEDNIEQVTDIVQKIPTNENFIDFTYRGIRAVNRMQGLLDLSKDLFNV